MALSYRVLGQSNPAANVLTTVYTVPSNANTIVSTVTICNQSANATTFSLAVKVANAAITNSQYINYNTPLPGSDTIALTIGMTLGATDVIAANVGSANVSVNIFGSEIT